jgi:hypothetical protein
MKGWPDCKPQLVFGLRAIGVLAALVLSCCIIGAYRTTGFGSDEEVIAAQLFLSLIITAPFCLVVTAGMRWRHKVALFGLVTFTGIVFSHVHAAVQESVVLRQYGQNPTSRIVVHRWFPYGWTTISYEPQMRAWIGDD